MMEHLKIKEVLNMTEDAFVDFFVRRRRVIIIIPIIIFFVFWFIFI